LQLPAVVIAETTIGAFSAAVFRFRHSPAMLRPGSPACSASWAARAFLEAMASGDAVEIDARYADLDLGLVDATVMALSEQQDLPILTFDFEHFRATRAVRGYWRPVVDEAPFREITA
jgi:hypothetical protein